MYAFRMMDGTWRIAKLTSSKIIPPTSGLPLDLWDAAYDTRASAENAMRRLDHLLDRQP
jgi:hypothetical protein